MTKTLNFFDEFPTTEVDVILNDVTDLQTTIAEEEELLEELCEDRKDLMACLMSRSLRTYFLIQALRESMQDLSSAPTLNEFTAITAIINKASEIARSEVAELTYLNEAILDKQREINNLRSLPADGMVFAIN